MDEKSGDDGRAAARTVVYDTTHLTHRLNYSAPTGIEKVDLRYAEYFAASASTIGLNYGLPRPYLISHDAIVALLDAAKSHWREDIGPASDPLFLETVGWLNHGGARPVMTATTEKRLYLDIRTITARVLKPLYNTRYANIPKDAIYLNVGQHALEHDLYFRWMNHRPDVKHVFFVHDVLPLTRPEFWPIDHEERFSKRIDCIARHASAFITSSEAARIEISHELARRGRSDIPSFSRHFPSLITEDPSQPFEGLAGVPYFIAVGTLEPRKNQIMLAHLWERLVGRPGFKAKLVLVGKKGWGADYLVSKIAQSASLREHVINISGLSDAGLKTLMNHATALLMPSFDEGFGIPVADALALRTPVIASDIPVFQEILGDNGALIDPFDGLGWERAILAALEGPEAKRPKVETTAALKQAYFADVQAFLNGL